LLLLLFLLLRVVRRVQVESRVMTPSQGFDEGADAIEWQSWTTEIKKK
jgi:hypothetical protein